MKIATLGPSGSFSEKAVLKNYGKDDRLFCSDVEQVLFSVIKEEADLGVLPYFNSSAGPVEQTREIIDFELTGESIILKDSRIKKIDEFPVPVVMNLVGLKNTRPENIEAIITHPKAAEQCSGYLKKSPADLVTSRIINGRPVSYTTSEAARCVSEEGASNIAAIASESVLEEYRNLVILEPEIQDNPDNRTYFFSFGRAD